MNNKRNDLVSIRICKDHKVALQSYCKLKNITESEYCYNKLLPFFDVLLDVNICKHKSVRFNP